MKLTPSRIRIWDTKHNRWFHGSTDELSRRLRTDAISIFGETIIGGMILHDQQEDRVWGNDPDIICSLDVLQYLVIVWSTGVYDTFGNEIFNGDIVEMKDFDNKSYYQTVTWGDGGFYLGYEIISEKLHYVDYAKVVGNIFEKGEYNEAN